jgi:hypothetical protein
MTPILGGALVKTVDGDAIKALSGATAAEPDTLLELKG